jgi:hypothetical protein
MRMSALASLSLAYAVATALIPYQTTAAGIALQSASLDKRSALNDVAAGRRDVSPEELVALVSSALLDSDAMVRRSALGAVAARAAAARLPVTEERLKRWNLDRPALQELRPAVMRLLEDPERFVRRDAIILLGSLDVVPRDDGRGEMIVLTEETVRLFASRYGVEPDTVVRAELVKSLVLIANRTEVQEAVVLKALADPSPGVVQFAVTGAGRMAIRGALPTLADLLMSHDDRGVRLVAAQAFAAYGAAAREYVPTLRIAASAERDPIVRKTLEGTLALLDK